MMPAMAPRRARSLRRATGTGVAILAALVTAAAVGAQAAPKPNDPGWPGQWGLRTTGISSVWSQVAKGVHPVVATIDTGADPGFPDLRGALVPGWDVLQNDATPRDTNSHGTQIATVIAARTNNGIGLSGACPICLLMPIRVSSDGHASPAAIAQGIRTAVNLGARILVISLAAGGDPDTGEQNAVDFAVAHGAVVIAAAGNEGGTAQEFPGALDGVVAVAGVDPSRSLYSWSTHGSWVELAGPGCVYRDVMCGSSFAPPYVAAAVALLVAAHPQRTPADAIQALRASARPVAGIGGGMIDAVAASALLGPPATPQAVRKQPPGVLVLQGTFRTSIAKRLRLGSGTLLLHLASGDVRGCSLALRSTETDYVAAADAQPDLRLTASVQGGPYLLDVSCPTPKARAYTLTASGVAAALP
jgi:subtilisin family serine protease